MKKSILTVAFLAILVSQSWAAWTPCTGDYAGWCKFGAGACNTINKGANDTDECSAAYLNCKDYGAVYSDKDCINFKEGNNPDYNVGCCKWGSGKCYKIKNPDELAECTGGSSVIPTCLDLTQGDETGTCPDDVGGGGGTEYCKWSETKCYEIANPNEPNEENPDLTNRENCIKNSSYGLFKNSACTGTPFAGGPLAPQDGQCADNQNRGLFCQWGGATGGCFSLKTNAEQTTCTAAISHCASVGEGVFWGVDKAQLTEGNGYGAGLTCVPLGGQPYDPSTPPSSSSNPGVSSSSGSNVAYARCIYDSFQYCQEGPLSACAYSNGYLTNDPCPYSNPIMISKIASANGALAIKNGVSLQVTKNATLEVFNLNGKRLRTLNFATGNWSVPLSDMPKGVYLVKVSFESNREILRVPVK